MDVKGLSMLLLLSSIGLVSAINERFRQNVNKTKAVVGRIIGGAPTNVRKVPWQVSLQYGSPGPDNHYCAGSIINESLIITASHCVSGIDDFSTDFIVAGMTSLEKSDKGQIRSFGEVIMHPDYNDDTLDNDIALIKLDTPLEYNRKTRPVNLPSAEDCENSLAGKRCITSGWGEMEGGFYPDILQKVALKCYDTAKCNNTRRYNGAITDGMLCAKRSNKDSCQGDSGGPLVDRLRPKDDVKLVGIVSWGYGCALKRYPGVYARICAYISWIQQKSQEA